MTVKWKTNQQLKHNIIILLAIKLLRQQVTSVRYFREELGEGEGSTLHMLFLLNKY